MKKRIIYEMKSLYRDDFRVTGYEFGYGEKTACIVGATRGNEVQQVYVCSQIIKRLKEIEASGNITEGRSILVIPSLNPFSMNIGKRFWVTDNTDINRMFPGYNLGETTQRIAAGVFEHIQDYEYGIQYVSNYISGIFIPHVRMMKTGFETPEIAKEFKLPYTVLRTPRPYDTTTLNYNWQIWETKAFSVYAGELEKINPITAEMSLEAVLRFLAAMGIIKYEAEVMPFESREITEDMLVTVKTKTAGILRRNVRINDYIREGDLLGEIINPYEGDVLEEIRAAVSGNIFFYNNNPLIVANTAAFRIVPE